MCGCGALSLGCKRRPSWRRRLANKLKNLGDAHSLRRVQLAREMLAACWEGCVLFIIGLGRGRGAWISRSGVRRGLGGSRAGGRCWQEMLTSRYRCSLSVRWLLFLPKIALKSSKRAESKLPRSVRIPLNGTALSRINRKSTPFSLVANPFLLHLMGESPSF
jgi:hypothetical protein